MAKLKYREGDELRLIDDCAAHCLRQKVQSFSEDGDCRYRGPNGLSCAIGWLMTDEDARRCEGKAAEDMDVLQAAGIAGDLARVAQDIQDIHDCVKPRDWHSRFRRLRNLWEEELNREDAV